MSLISLIVPVMQLNSFEETSPLVISADVDPNVISTDQKTIVTVNLKNNASVTISGIDVQLETTGLKVLDQKKWPESIYPNSSLSGMYILQPTNDGVIRFTFQQHMLSIKPLLLRKRQRLLILNK